MNKDFKKIVIAQLKILSSAEEQVNYQKNIPIADTPAELFCGWFDDVYHPETDLFKSTFSEDEQKVLAEFNDFFKKREEKIPTTSLEEMQKNKEWNEIMEKAKETLKLLNRQNFA